jgi:hypothetical protein
MPRSDSTVGVGDSGEGSSWWEQVLDATILGGHPGGDVEQVFEDRGRGGAGGASSVPATNAPPSAVAPGAPFSPPRTAPVLPSAGSIPGLTPELLDQVLANAPQSSPFDAVLAQLGLDPTTQVFARRWQTRRSSGDVVFGAEVPSLNPQGPTRRVFGVDVPELEQVDASRSAVDLLGEFYALEGDQLLDLQRSLYAAGFMGDVDIADVYWGQHDEESFSAWARAVGRAARYFAVGEELTVDDVIRTAARERLGGLGEGAGTGQQRVVHLADPAALAQLLDTAATAVLGRRATAGQQQMFVGVIHRLQREGQLAAQPVSPSTNVTTLDVDRSGTFDQGELDAALDLQTMSDGVTEVVQVNPTAQAGALLRQQNPTEAGAHDIDLAFRQFIESLRGIV